MTLMFNASIWQKIMSDTQKPPVTTSTVTKTTNINMIPDILECAVGIIMLVALFWWTDVEISFTKKGEVGIYMEFGPNNIFDDG